MSRYGLFLYLFSQRLKPQPTEYKVSLRRLYFAKMSRRRPTLHMSLRIYSPSLYSYLFFLLLLAACTSQPEPAAVETIATQPTAVFTATHLPPTATQLPTPLPTQPATPTIPPTPIPTQPPPTAVPRPDDLHFRLFDQLGGSTQAIALHDDYILLGMGPRLVAANVSDPTNPHIFSQSPPLPDVVRDIAIADNLAYVAAGQGGLIIFDLANLLADGTLTQVSQTAVSTITFHTITIHQDSAYLLGESTNFNSGSSNTLYTYDIHEPSAPQQRASRRMGYNYSIVPIDNYIYLVNNERIEIIDPANPAETIKQLPFAQPAYGGGIQQVGDSFYLVEAGVEHGPRRLDVSDPLNPVLEPALPGPANYGTRLAAAGSILYQASTFGEFGHCSSFLFMRDLADVETAVSDEGFPLESCATVIAANNNYLYVATLQGLRIYDLTNPLQPQFVSELQHPSGLTSTTDLLYDNERLYVLTGDGNGPTLHSFDVGEMGELTAVLAADATPFAPLLVDAGSGELATIYNNHLIVGIWQNGFRLVDLETMQPVGSLTSDVLPGADIFTAELIGDLLYINSHPNVAIVSLADPTQPTLIGRVEVSYLFVSAFTAGNGYLAIVSQDGDHTIDIFDLTNPQQPTKLGNIQPTSAPDSLAIVGNYLYLGCNPWNCKDLMVYDLQTLEQVAATNLPAGSHKMKVAADKLYISTFDDGIWIVDVREPTAPKPIGHVAIPGLTPSLAVSGNRLYVATMNAGLYVLEAD